MKFTTFYCLLLIVTSSHASLPNLDKCIKKACSEQVFPGAVACIYHQGRCVYHKAFGTYTYDKNSPHMTTQTCFDVASLTKILTTISVMILHDQQKLFLEDSVAQHLPSFRNSDKKNITIKQLLTHTSGITDTALYNSRHPQEIISNVSQSILASPPGTKFLYADTNMILLQALIEKISGMPLDQFVQQEITHPLGMKSTTFNPQQTSLCAPTRRNARNRPYLLQGEVDDDRAYVLNGIAGHAGIFSTAHDFARCMLLLLNNGAYTHQGKRYRLLQPATVQKFTSLQSKQGKRGYGFEIGRYITPQAFGHLGWTGTSAWADKDLDLCCVVFTNRVHPTYGDIQKIKNFREKFHTCVIDALKPGSKKIRVGAEQIDTYLPLLHNKRVGVVTNHTALVGKTHLVDALRAQGIKIQTIFTPEHGFRGQTDAGIPMADTVDTITHIPVISLYGAKKKPTAQDLQDIDILVFDMQDIGVRFYTYISTLQKIMEAAAEHHIPLLVLDRPNPNGFYVDGPVCEVKSFVGLQPIPIVHGMTVGEYAHMLNGEQWLANTLRCNLTVIPCKGYSHKDLYQLPIFPSPNIKSMNAVYLYPSTCLFEGTTISVGRGTKHPFELFGHPEFPKTKFSFIPKKQSNKDSTLLRHAGKICYGYNLHDAPNHTLKKLNKQVRVHWLQKAYKLCPHKKDFFTNYFACLAGNKLFAEQIQQNMTEQEIRASWEPGLQKFKKIRKKYLLYEDFA